ncbi:MAG: Bax inhibitor-1/YccA family protein [Candidatus Marinimicrobia bacterium]|nr:Bax inhibitor-1/YccA family protein [Candidatus Neomarinimicrobiota bacterium]
MRTHNPVFGRAFSQAGRISSAGTKTMSISGTIDKAVILFFVTLIGATYAWNQFYAFDETGIAPGSLFTIGLIVGLIAALATIFKPQWAPVSSIVYAGAEGLLLGSLTAMVNAYAPGLGIQAVGLTLGVLFTMLALYRFRIIRVTNKLRAGIISATGGIFIFYLIMMVMGMFGAQPSFMYNSSPLGLGISLIIIGVAALNLLLDFDFIERADGQGLPAYMDWYAAFGLMVTLIWLYIEILSLLSRIRE